MYDITIHVEDEKDLYNGFDPSKETLSDDFVSYLEGQLEDRKIGEHIQLNIESEKSIDSTQFEKAMDILLESRRKKLAKDRRLNKLESVRLMVIGCFFVVVGIVFADVFTSVVAAIISTIGSFSIWEACNIWIKEIPAIRLQSAMIKVLENYKVVVKSK